MSKKMYINPSVEAMPLTPVAEICVSSLPVQNDPQNTGTAEVAVRHK